jgi:hypothetical protein
VKRTKGYDVFEFLRKQEEKPSVYDGTIEALLKEMMEGGFSSEDSPVIAGVIRTLAEAKAMEPKPKSVSPDTKALVMANLAGIILILGFERANVVTSKALGFILKTRT